jgi:hypothetical protein
VHDITVSGMPCVRESAAILRHETAGKAREHADDEMLARLLITSWTLATGRTLPAGVPPQLLSTDRAIRRSLIVTIVILCSHELECPYPVAADPFCGFLDGVLVFHAE